MLFAAPPDTTSVTPTFKCGTADAPGICYAVGPKTQNLFLGLQAAANRFAPRVGFAPLFVDGKIGDLTVKALQKIAMAMLADPMTAAVGVGLTPLASTKESIAAAASSITTLLRNGYSILQLPPVDAPTVQTTSPVPAPSTTLPAPPPTAGSGLPWKWIAGGAAVLAVGYFAFVRKPHKGKGRAAAAAH